ncbi:phosphoribosylanthranilate isomerase [Acetivibrio cellulolyticus]|uniref:phosphoribosylanthranilate isomerase n=1 Tax=Acetivibrio cellulolyticus TaxID=35830 RepID=UPI0001E2D174|nr:phosphoribosylanthranilate isomerase [Acetivibrio cellulolyticus]
MTKIKICGIKRIEDIQFVNKYKPQYIGFVFAESKRRVSVDQVRYLKQGLDPQIKTVGVFVNESIDKIVEVLAECKLNCIQVHGDETPQYIDTLKGVLGSQPAGKGVEIWKAVRVKDEKSIAMLKSYVVDAFLLDAFVEGSYGGAGKVFDWKLANLAKSCGRIFVAGGLNADNVSNAVEASRPYGVDVSSGVETEGCKDESKIRCFMDKVKGVDNCEVL